MMEKQCWHPVAQVQDVVAAPLAAQLLSEAVVLWRDAQGRVQAFSDRCPHRGARLSMGRVEDGHLECPYHGWQFSAGGQCRKIPAMPEYTPSATQRVQSFEVQEAYGLVWLRLQEPSEARGEVVGQGQGVDQSAEQSEDQRAQAAALHALPVFAAESDTRLRKLNCGPYDVQASAPRIIENFLDMSHFGFVHEGWLGSRDTTAMLPYEVQRTAGGVLATGCKVVQPQSNLHSTQPAVVEYSYEVTAPYTAVLTKIPEAGTSKDGWREAIALFICPLTPETSRVWFRLAVADFDTSDEELKAFQHTIFTQDQPVLESQMPKALPLDPRAELHSSADRMSNLYRRYLKECGVEFGVC